jgi:hypothetical protein
VTEQRRLALQNSSDSIEMVGPERDARIHSGQLQVAAVIAPLAQAVVPLVVDRAKFARSRLAAPEPFNELHFDLCQLRLRGDRLGVVEDAPRSRRLVNLVVDHRRPKIESVIQKVNRIHSRRAPGLRRFN